MPGSASGGMDGIAVKPLTVDFHEGGFHSKLNQENALGFWFQLSDKQRQQAGSPWGPANAQALNRYSYVQNNPMKWTDPSGHITLNASDAADLEHWIDTSVIPEIEDYIDGDTSWASAVNAIATAVTTAMSGAAGIVATGALELFKGLGTPGSNLAKDLLKTFKIIANELDYFVKQVSLGKIYKHTMMTMRMERETYGCLVGCPADSYRLQITYTNGYSRTYSIPGRAYQVMSRNPMWEARTGLRRCSIGGCHTTWSRAAG